MAAEGGGQFIKSILACTVVEIKRNIRKAFIENLDNVLEVLILSIEQVKPSQNCKDRPSKFPLYVKQGVENPGVAAATNDDQTLICF